MKNIQLNHRLRNLREKHKLTQAQVSEKLGITRSSYSYYESGKTEPSLDSIIILSKLYNITVDDIISERSKLFKTKKK